MGGQDFGIGIPGFHFLIGFGFGSTQLGFRSGLGTQRGFGGHSGFGLQDVDSFIVAAFIPFRGC